MFRLFLARMGLFGPFPKARIINPGVVRYSHNGLSATFAAESLIESNEFFVFIEPKHVWETPNGGLISFDQKLVLKEEVEADLLIFDGTNSKVELLD
ncbi:hypothetical protein [uncultured Litoreibacter sp.]|uniref:hypothetical protein n=1 Tax=uncultured Litoreibacter sp. TaxID=1392394 RepID=UPI002606B3C6|nr:hypothetical protein [uncultured Litoreibacter sp.]